MSPLKILILALGAWSQVPTAIPFGFLRGGRSSVALITACGTATPAVGAACGGGGLRYGGMYNGAHYMVAPSNCNYAGDSCAGGVDLSTTPDLLESWGVVGTVYGAASMTDGRANTATIAAVAPAGAALRCSLMTVGGHTDWFLPARDEAAALFYGKTSQHFLASGTFSYWTSTEVDFGNAYVVKPGASTFASNGKGGDQLFRCVRRIE